MGVATRTGASAYADDGFDDGDDSVHDGHEARRDGVHDAVELRWEVSEEGFGLLGEVKRLRRMRRHPWLRCRFLLMLGYGCGIPAETLECAVFPRSGGWVGENVMFEQQKECACKEAQERAKQIHGTPAHAHLLTVRLTSPLQNASRYLSQTRAKCENLVRQR